MGTKSRKKRLSKVQGNRSTFLDDPLESVFTHVGKFIDKLSPKDLVDLGIYGGLAYIGGDTFGFPLGALVGPIALKLATTQGGGILPGSQAAGLLLLGYMGLTQLSPDDEPKGPVGDVPLIQPGQVCEAPKINFRKGGEVYCREGYSFHTDNQGNLKCCIPVGAPIEEPVPEPPLEGWTEFYTQGLYICKKHYCGAQVCGFTPPGLDDAVQQHMTTVHGEEPPPPPPPPQTGWSELFEDQYSGWCRTHLDCGATICSFYLDELERSINLHSCPTPNGAE